MDRSEDAAIVRCASWSGPPERIVTVAVKYQSGGDGQQDLVSAAGRRRDAFRVGLVRGVSSRSSYEGGDRVDNVSSFCSTWSIRSAASDEGGGHGRGRTACSLYAAGRHRAVHKEIGGDRVGDRLPRPRQQVRMDRAVPRETARVRLDDAQREHVDAPPRRRPPELHRRLRERRRGCSTPVHPSGTAGQRSRCPIAQSPTALSWAGPRVFAAGGRPQEERRRSDARQPR